MSPGLTEPVPILVGGLSEAAFRRAARNDGWVSDLMTTAELGEARRRIDHHRPEAGTEARPFSLVGSASDALDVDGYRRLEEVGVTDLLTLPWVFYGGFTDDLQQKIDGLRRFADDVLGAVAA